jgi:CheY-like chemotaxis protein
MDFDEVLARTVNLLERQGFATYRTLKRRFHLDDATLAALKSVLVDTQHLAADDTGTRLVWLGALRPGSGPTRLEEEYAAPVAVVPSSLAAPRHRAWTPLVGREAEVALLQARWAPVLAGQGQAATLGGEAGMGKSRLVQVVKAQGAEWPHQRWECRCDPALQHSVLAPIIELFQRGFHLQPDEPPASKLQKLADALAPFAVSQAEVVPLLASLLAVPLDTRYTLPPLSPAQQKQRLLEAIWTLLAALKADPELADIPVIMVTIVDDKDLGYVLGAADYLTKPVDRDRLAAILQKYQGEDPSRLVLVIEDEGATRQMLRRTLEKEGWTVSEAENGRVGFERLGENRPALILLDLMMPEMDGFAFVTALRNHREWHTIPVVVVTAKDLTPAERQRLNGHVEQILQKTAYSREDLLREVRDLVAQGVR